MSLPIAIPRARRTDAESDMLSPCSSFGGLSNSASSSWTPSGVYVPVHKRRSAASSATSSAASSPGKSTVPLPNVAVHNPLVYSRDTLLLLAKSSLSASVSAPRLDIHDLHVAFPNIVRENGGEIQRALEMAGRPNRFQKRRPRAKKGANDNALDVASGSEAVPEVPKVVKQQQSNQNANANAKGSERRERRSKGKTNSGSSNSGSSSKPKNQHRRDASLSGSERSWRGPSPRAL